MHPTDNFSLLRNIYLSTLILLQLLKKYRSSANALCAAQAEAREASARAEAAAEEARQARDRLAELAARLTAAEAGHTMGQHEAERRLEMRNKVREPALDLYWFNRKKCGNVSLWLSYLSVVVIFDKSKESIRDVDATALKPSQ